MQHSLRLRRLRKLSAAPAVLITHLPDVRYLCGFTGSNAALAVTAGSAVLFTDGRYTTQAREQTKAARVRITKKPGVSALSAAVRMLADAGVASATYDPARTTVVDLDQMQRALPDGVKLAARRRFFTPMKESLSAKLRLIKDEDEIGRMEAAALVGCRIFDEVLPMIEPGMRERDLAAEIEFLARAHGADAMSFETIVASGPRSALPHGHASESRLPKRGFVTLDFGVNLEGYCSDMTRTVHMSKASREESLAYDAVLEAQQAAVSAVRAGVSCGEVDEAARAVLRRAGLGAYFIHSTGHGVGLEIHEAPRIAARQETLLATGMIITVEPGVYLPGKFGVRIEDMVLVQPDGPLVLTPTTKALIEL